MAIFRLLLRRYPGEVPAGEIGAALELKPSTASVYLSALMSVGLIGQRRKGTSLLYKARLDSAREVVSDLFLDCCKGRPDLCPPILRDPREVESTMSDEKFNALFICRGNSARSIFAEAILRHEAGGMFNVFSAGTKPSSELNPFAVEMLKNKGISTDGLWAKIIGEYQKPDSPEMHFVFTVCDQAANEECPAWPGQPITAHWGLPDPVKAEGTDAQKRLAFQQTFGQMRNRIVAFAALPFASLERVSLQRAVDAIGKVEEDA